MIGHGAARGRLAPAAKPERLVQLADGGERHRLWREVGRQGDEPVDVPREQAGRGLPEVILLSHVEDAVGMRADARVKLGTRGVRAVSVVGATRAFVSFNDSLGRTGAGRVLAGAVT